MSSSASSLKDNGTRLYRDGQHQEALAKFEQARAEYAKDGDLGMAAEMLNNIGLVQRGLKNFDAAAMALNTALDEFRALGDRSREGLTLGNLGALAESQGNPAAAEEHYQQAVDLFRELGEKDNEAFVLKSMSALQLKQGRQLEAVATMDAALANTNQPSLRQRALRQLLKWPMRLIGR